MKTKHVFRTFSVWFMAVLALFSGYLYLTDLNFYKSSLIASEFLISFLIAFYILKNDVKEVRTNSRIKQIYKNEKQGSADEVISQSLIDLAVSLFVVLSAITLCISVYLAFKDPYGATLALKTVISVMIAYGCVLIFGKITLKYTVDKLLEASFDTIDGVKLNHELYES